MKLNSRYFNTIFRHCCIWTAAIGFWALMRQFGQELVDGPTFNSLMELITVYLIMGITGGILLGSLEYLFEHYGFYNRSFGQTILFASLTYTLFIYLLVFIGISVFALANRNPLHWDLYQNFLFSNEMILLLIYFFIVGFIVVVVKEIDKKFGPGNLWKMITGAFYTPKEVVRIFMFLDLKASTTLAEKLGHIRYSSLIQDCFQDLNVVQKYSAAVYQYVGDEAVLVWEATAGLTNANCIQAFFAFTERLAQKSAEYRRKYGWTPEFKAGLNIGTTVMAEVGGIKREIAYHGDTINTAARIQGACNTYGKALLISEALRKQLLPDLSFRSTEIGDVQLKGKSAAIKIYSVDKVYGPPSIHPS